MSELFGGSTFDVGLELAAIAGLGMLLAFVGVHRLTHREIGLVERMGAWDSVGSGAPRDKPDRQPSFGHRLEVAVGRRSFAAAAQRDLARANLKLTVTEYLLGHVAMVGGGALLGLLLGGMPLALVLAVPGFYAPRLIVGIAQRRRLKAFGGQLADTLMLMSNSLRAGYSLLQSMETVSREGAEPTAEEFGRVVREVGLGLSPEEALANLQLRMPGEDLNLMVTAINVQHEVGGNLATIFDTLCETIRERARITGEIQTLTAQQRMGGYVITLLPVAIGGGLFLMSPSYLMPLFTSEQVVCVPAFALPIGAGLLMIAGFAVIQRIVAIEV